MNVHGLNSILQPARIAVTGVSINPNNVGGRVLRNLVGGTFKGAVYPVNPSSEAVLGIPCHPCLEALPRVPDLVIVCSAAQEVAGTLDQAGRLGVGGAIVMSAGFVEAGEAGARWQNELAEVKRGHPGMRVLGPNCLGVIVPAIQLNASFAPAMPEAGGVAFLSQSGALCTSVLDWAREKRIGFSAFVSVGNALDVGFAELIDYFGEDERTSSIVLYVESVKEARRFLTAARAFARSKPIVVYKAGRFPESAAVAASHTGAMVSADAVYDAAFARVGLVRVLDVGEVFGCVELIGRRKLPGGPRLGIVTNAGGPGVMAVDALIDRGGELAKLSEDTMTRLDGNLPGFWSRANPVDILGDANTKRYEKACGIVLAEPGVDALLVILTPQAMTRADGVARVVGRLVEGAGKPVLACWMGGESIREGVKVLTEAGVPVYGTPEQAVAAFMTLVRYARNLQALYQTPRDIRLELGAARAAADRYLAGSDFPRAGVAGEGPTKAVLELYGIPTTRPVPAPDASSAEAAAEAMGYPVALKLNSPDISHKTEAGGVELNLGSGREVRQAFDRIVARGRQYRPGAMIRGVTVQRMARTADGVELILGFKRDPVFGTVVLLGAGGTQAELLADSALGFPPLNETLVRRMLEPLKVTSLLNGYRGRPRAHIDALVEAVMRVSYLAVDRPGIVEMDINPLLCTPEGVVVLDARAVVDPAGVPGAPFGHLALRPYPEEFVSRGRLKDGTEVTLRPIRPEDEPLWFELLGSCSKESIYSRFRFFYHWATHEAAVRHCYIDYDRELAIVAECEQGARRLLGVGRLVADPDRRTAEYAVLVGDQWQNRGLGGLLTDTCERIAGQWGVHRIEAQTTSANSRMVHLFTNRQWVGEPGEEGVLELSKALAGS